MPVLEFIEIIKFCDFPGFKVSVNNADNLHFIGEYIQLHVNNANNLHFIGDYI